MINWKDFINAALIALTISLTMTSSAVDAQMAPFPSWGNGLATTDTEIAGRSSALWATIRHQFVLVPKHTSGDVGHGLYVYRNQTNSGTLAVWSISQATLSKSPLGGITTAFTDVLFLTMAPVGTVYPTYEKLLLWTGKMSNGKWGVQLLPLTSAAAPSNANVVTPPITSQAGEIWLTAGIIGPYLYILDAAHGKLIRFSCSGQDQASTFNTRDTGFSVSLPDEGQQPYYAIIARTGYTAQLIADPYHPGNPFRYLIKTNGTSHQFLVLPRDPPFGSIPVFLRGPCGGVTTLAVVGPSAQAIKVQIAPSVSGPWADVSQPKSLGGPTQVVVIPLTSALAQNSYVRLYNVTTTSAGSAVMIAAAHPRIFYFTPLVVTNDRPVGHIESNKPFTIVGDNLDLAPTVTLYARKLPGDPGSTTGTFALQPTSATKTTIVVNAPDITCAGTIVVTNGHGEDRKEITIRKP